MPPNSWGEIPTTDTLLILLVEACVKKIFQLGRQYPWPRPERCLLCGGRIWGHGFSPGYFDGFDSAVLLRRYRCPDCGALYKLRPKGYWSRFQASIASIRQSLAHRLTRLRWRPDLPRSRQQHWLRGLILQVRFRLGSSWTGCLLEAFDVLSGRGIAAASRSTQCAVPLAPW